MIAFRGTSRSWGMYLAPVLFLAIGFAPMAPAQNLTAKMQVAVTVRIVELVRADQKQLGVHIVGDSTVAWEFRQHPEAKKDDGILGEVTEGEDFLAVQPDIVFFGGPIRTVPAFRSSILSFSADSANASKVGIYLALDENPPRFVANQARIHPDDWLYIEKQCRRIFDCRTDVNPGKE